MYSYEDRLRAVRLYIKLTLLSRSGAIQPVFASLFARRNSDGEIPCQRLNA